MTTTQQITCANCYDAAEKAGRTIRMTDLYAYPLCQLCENRMREGLIHYRPSNGTEFRMFLETCESCRHYTDDLENPKPGRLQPPHTCCKWGILDRFYVGMTQERDHSANWFTPDQLEKGCPASCRKWVHRDDPNGEDAPTPDVPGQLMLVEALPVILERAEFNRVDAANPQQ